MHTKKAPVPFMCTNLLRTYGPNFGYQTSPNHAGEGRQQIMQPEAWQAQSLMAACLEGLEDPAAFFQPNPLVLDILRKLLQKCHDQLIAGLDSVSQPDPLPPSSQLYIEGFDAEQIWAQIDMQMVVYMKRIRCVLHLFQLSPYC
jgi:hypothetical protein